MKRLHALDTLRGIAALRRGHLALAALLRHQRSMAGGWQRTAQPFYWVLKPIYDAGWIAVDLFFALSGFIFFWLYAPAIREGAIGLGKFAWLRFSRLYPLHVVTLIVVAILQYFFHRATSHFFIYQINDLQHFLAGLVMAQQWLPINTDQTFNGPAWSVSIEVLLYGIFFGLCRVGLRGGWWSLLVSVLAIPLLARSEFLSRGAMGFFLGGAIFAATNYVAARPDAARIARWLCAAALAGWTLVVIDAYFGPLHSAAYWIAGHISDGVGAWYIADSEVVFVLLFIYTVSPLTIIALALHERVLGGKWERFSFVGDISYSTYLLHFPMQLSLALIAAHFALTSAFFENGLALLIFYAVLIGLGTLSFNAFERPMQSWLRKRLPERSTARGQV
ncbi:MAG: acyltransferase [Rhizomicrobium sp.]